MSDFSVRSDSVDVEQIMRQIRARIRDKRGVDYTEQQIQELANAKLDKFLDARGVRSDLLEQYRQQRGEGGGRPATYAFEDTTLFESDKPVVRFFRKLLQPVLKLFFNYNTLNNVLHTQAAFNDHVLKTDDLYYELVHNVVIELTRSTIELKNLKMRVEALQSRLEFTERRARALEGVVQYKPEALRGVPRSDAPPPAAVDDGTEPQGGVDPITGGDSVRTRRRRRRRGRRGQGGPLGSDQPAGMSGGEQDPDADGGDDLSAADDSRDVGSGPPSGSALRQEPVPQPRPLPPPRSVPSSGSDPQVGSVPDPEPVPPRATEPDEGQ